MADRKRTKVEEMSHSEFHDKLARDIKELEVMATEITEIPQGWWRLDREMPANPKKEQISIRIDEDVMAFFRGYGYGFQTRMNTVLRMYMQARLSKVIRVAGEESTAGDLL